MMNNLSTRNTLTVWRSFALLILAGLLLGSTAAVAEDHPCKSKGGDITIKVPELAKRMKIAGIVRLELQLTPLGTVREIKVLGGNPVLVSAVEGAVRQAKFEKADSCIVVYEFRD